MSPSNSTTIKLDQPTAVEGIHLFQKVGDIGGVQRVQLFEEKRAVLGVDGIHDARNGTSVQDIGVLTLLNLGFGPLETLVFRHGPLPAIARFPLGPALQARRVKDNRPRMIYAMPRPAYAATQGRSHGERAVTETILTGQVLGYRASPFEVPPEEAARIDEAVLVRNGLIVETGRAEDLREQAPAAVVEDLGDALITARFRRCPCALPPDRDHRQLGQAADRLAEHLYLSRRDALCRSGLCRADRSAPIST
jgi:hypothetical protein